MSIEGSQWMSENSESSSEEDKDWKTKNKKNNKASESRWVRPPFLHPEQAKVEQPKEVSESPWRMPIPVEKVDVSETDDDADEESKSDTVAGEVVDSDGSRESEESGPPRGGSELLDIPHVAEGEPFRSTFEEIIEREMPPEFVRATSGAELGDDPRTAEASEPWEPISGRSPFASSEETPLSTPPTESSSRWWPDTSARSETVPAPEPEAAASSPGGASPVRELLSSSGFSAALETLKAVNGLAEIASNPYPMVSRVLMELAVKGYLEERKQQRYPRLEQQLHQRDERINQLQQQQQHANEQLAAHVNQEVAAHASQAQEQVILDQAGNEIVLQPGWRVERSPGGYSAVVDEHGRVVHDAIKYGEAFKREQQREQLSDDLFNAISSGGAIGLPSSDQGNHSQDSDPISAGQPYNYQPLPPENVDLRHRLSAPHNLAKDTITSPWLWTAVAILIIFYFVASLA